MDQEWVWAVYAYFGKHVYIDLVSTNLKLAKRRHSELKAELDSSDGIIEMVATRFVK